MTRLDPDARAPFTPPRPVLVATGFLSLWVAILSLPMLAGKWLASPVSDQYHTGYAFRVWGAEQLRATGHIPLWNPELFGGLPFVAAQHGDIFYLTSWLRLLLPTDVVMNLGFVIHYLAAGLFTYLLLRMLGLSWLSAVVGGLAYQLSGVLASYPSPGHDGKLFVSALLPLSLIALVLALRRRRWEGYALLALSVGLALLSPHYQMTYYMLIAAGLFALYLTFWEPVSGTTPMERVWRLGVALAAVVVGFGVAMIQVLPFYSYIPFSPRAAGYYGFAGSTSYAIPWEHVPEFILSGFVGSIETYWGSNPLKLHSEYLGLPVVALAVLGVVGARKRLALWIGGIGGLFFLISMGAATPFYRVWYVVMPFVKQTRAPGMAFYVVALAIATFAALGAERLERGEGRKHVLVWLGVAGTVLLLAVTGVFGAIAESLARANEVGVGRPVAAAAVAGQSSIRWGAALSGVALAVVAGLAFLHLRRSVPQRVFAVGLVLLIGADLWRSGREFWMYTSDAEALYQADAVTERIKSTPEPYRVLDFKTVLPEVYPGGALMAHGIPQLLGHHGNELHRFDELLGGKNQWTNLLQSLRSWDLFAVRYVILPAVNGSPDSIPGFMRVRDAVPTSAGVPATLFAREQPVEYARLVPAAVKVDDELAIGTVLDPRVDPDRVVLLAPDAPVDPAAITALPEPLAVSTVFEVWEPGKMTIRITPPAPGDAYLVISENWYPDWTATVDGHPAPVIRGNVTLITVPVPKGAEVVELSFKSAEYRLGKAISFLSLGLVVLGFVVPAVLRKRARG